MPRARVRRVKANFLRSEAQRVRADGGNRGLRREGGLILALLHDRGLDSRVGEDHEIEVWFVHCTAQRSIEGRRGGRVLLTVPSVRIRDAAKPGDTKRAEAIPRKVVGLEKLHKGREFRDECLCWRRNVHYVQERGEGDGWTI